MSSPASANDSEREKRTQAAHQPTELMQPGFPSLARRATPLFGRLQCPRCVDVLLAAVIGAQGLKGEVKVKTFTQAPDALRAYGVLHDARGRTYEITAFRPAKPGEAVIAFKGIGDRNAAEALKAHRADDFVVTRRAARRRHEDEFYHADLIGLEAFDCEGRLVGKVAAIHNFGAGDVIEILARRWRRSAAGLHGRDWCRQIDIAGGRIQIACAVRPEDDEDEMTMWVNDGVFPSPLAGEGGKAA